MAVTAKQETVSTHEVYQQEVRDMVMAGLNQIKEGKTKDFNTVCDRLEKKYRDAALQN